MVIGLQNERWKVLGIRMSWIIVAIWFSANLLSQAIYLGFNGEPYDANAILSSLGHWYWICLAIELGIWVTFGALILQKLRFQTNDDVVPESI